MSEKVDLIYDIVKSDRAESIEFRKDVRASQTQTQEKLAKIEALDIVQNAHLAEHIRRTDLLEVLHKENTDRIIKLEEPRIAIEKVKKWTIGSIAVISGIIGLLKLIGII